MSKEPFDLLVKGKLKRRETSKFIISDKVKGKWSYWYVGNVILEKGFRGKNLQLRLLEGAARSWLNSGDASSKVKLCGLGYSEDAIALLKYFRFIHEGKYFNEFPVYTRNDTIEELRKDYEELIVKRMWDAQVSW